MYALEVTGMDAGEDSPNKRSYIDRAGRPFPCGAWRRGRL